MLESYIKGLTAGEGAMLFAAVVVFVVAAFVLWGWRWGTRFDRGEKPRFTFPGVGEVSEPTRLLAGWLGLVLAYHLVVWTLPESATPLQVPRERWWVLAMVAVAAAGGSLALDRKDGKPRSG